MFGVEDPKIYPSTNHPGLKKTWLSGDFSHNSKYSQIRVKEKDKNKLASKSDMFSTSFKSGYRNNW